MKKSIDYISFNKWFYILQPVFIYFIAHILITQICVNEILSTYIVVPFMILWYIKENLNKNDYKIKNMSFKAYLHLLVMILSISISSVWISYIFGVNTLDNTNMSVLEFMAITIIGPINEEIVYRGILFKRSNKVLGRAFSVIFSSVLFGVAHIGIVNIVMSIIVGIILCLLDIRYNTLRAGITVHIFVNAFSFFSIIKKLPAIIFVLSFLGLIILSVDLVLKLVKKDFT